MAYRWATHSLLQRRPRFDFADCGSFRLTFQMGFACDAIGAEIVAVAAVIDLARISTSWYGVVSIPRECKLSWLRVI